MFGCPVSLLCVACASFLHGSFAGASRHPAFPAPCLRRGRDEEHKTRAESAARARRRAYEAVGWVEHLRNPSCCGLETMGFASLYPSYDCARHEVEGRWRKPSRAPRTRAPDAAQRRSGALQSRGPSHRMSPCRLLGPGSAQQRSRVAARPGHERAAAPHLPVHTGLRFSPNAFSPSFASSVMASSAIWLSV